MRLLPASELLVPTNRQRREFNPDDLLKLQYSIEHLGLMHPLVVRGNTLVAGERRQRAIRQIWELEGSITCHNQTIPPGFYPVIDMGELSEVEALEAEYEENVIRTDLTWQEKASAYERLHLLRSAQQVQRGSVQTVADTAKEITGRADGYFQDSIRQNLILAKHLDNPLVAKAKDAREAFKILKREEESREMEYLAAAVGPTFGAHSHRLLLGDTIEGMVGLVENSFDIILTDPPYGMGADDFGDGAGKLTGITHEYDDSFESFERLMEAAAVQFARVARPAAHLYVCCDLDNFFFLRSLFTRVGAWNVFRTPLINVKDGSGRVPLPEHGPRRQYETILYGYRGGRRVTAIYPDVIHSRGDENLGHGAQKPVELFTNLLRRSARPGDTCLDPFAGTGTIFPAAHGLKVAATGIEKEPAYYGIAVKRIEALK